MSISKDLQLAIDSARAGGKVLLDFYQRKNYEVYTKADKSPVTDADMASDKLLHELLAAGSSYAILSEEGEKSDERLARDSLWIVDPLDGTRDFVARTDQFCVIIGLARRGVPVLGAVYAPVQDVMYFAESGGGAWKQVGAVASVRFRVSEVADLGAARLLVNQLNVKPEILKAAEGMGIKHFLSGGGMGLKLCALAEGAADVHFNGYKNLAEWDTCAPEIILLEAGGEITDLQGGRLGYNAVDIYRGRGTLATNGVLHKAMVAGLAPYREGLVH